MRRTLPVFNYWVRYSVIGQSPKADGPPPQDAPQNFNDTKAVPNLDPVEDNFPVSIRGGLHYPDVPLDQLTPMWYIGDQFGIEGRELRSWTASAPAHAYRFRPFDEFDSKGRAFVEGMRAFKRDNAIMREPFLSKMNDASTTPKISSQTRLDDEIAQHFKKNNRKSVLAVQRDSGRLERPPQCAGSIAVDGKTFPFSWNTEDWYEFEVSNVRTRRHHVENGADDSEVTYKIVIEALWEHHAQRMANDVCDFIRDIGRQVVEEKLRQTTAKKLSLLNGGPIDADIFHSSYSNDEVRAFCVAELEALEAQCKLVLSQAGVTQTNRADSNVSWPVVSSLEPWARMVEYWAAMGDKHYSHMEMSTRKVEFRKYFRVVTVRMPFVSLDLEKRLYDIRHWAHRSCTIEYQTIFRSNAVHDNSVFPVEHDPVQPATHENHRLFSFALDWEESPAGFATQVTVHDGDSWQTLAAKLGTTESILREQNSQIFELRSGDTVSIPPEAKNVPRSSGTAVPWITVRKEGGDVLFRTWEDIAEAIGCEPSELMELNSAAMDNDGKLRSDVEQVRVPIDLFDDTDAFSHTETVMNGDTWQSLACRLGTSIDSLKKQNNDAELVPGSSISIPPDSKRRRRLSDPLLNVKASVEATARLVGEMKHHNLPEGIPLKPAEAKQFPFEYLDSTSRYPFTPEMDQSCNNWLSYTAQHLDKGLGEASEATPSYNVNELWPFQQVPGTVDQTPFEEDQTWMMHHIPLQRQEMIHKEGYLQDLPNVNHEHFPRSLQWAAP